MNRADRRKTAKTEKERMEDYIMAGRQLMEAGGNPQEAQRFFKQVLAIDPHSGQANLYLGIMEMWSRNYAKANELFQKAYQADPQNPAILNNLALSIHEQGAIPEAILIYRKVLKLDAENVEAQVNLARGLMSMGKNDEGLAEAKRAVEIGPQFGTGQLLLGTIAQTMGDHETAKAALGEAIRLMPGNMEANFRLCREIYDEENPDAQLAPAREIFMANRATPEAALVYSQLLFGMGRYDEAIANLLPHAEAEHLGLRLNIVNALANTHADKGSLEEAVSFHKKAIAVSADDPHTRYYYGKTLNMMGDHKSAAIQMQKTMPMLQFAQDALAHATLAQKKSGDAKPFADEVLRLVVELDLTPSAGFASMEELNNAVIGELSKKTRDTIHPFDYKRRIGKTSWESSLSPDNGEAIAALGENLHDKITLYVADMPEGYEAHPLLGRKEFGIGNTRSWTESFSTHPGGATSIDQTGWFKGIYFNSVPEECDDENAKNGWLQIGVPQFSTEKSIAPDLEIKPVAGKLVLLPAYYWHGFRSIEASTDMVITSIHIDSRRG
jgi:tetratricopeptide (TPR) repeat protein